MRSSQTGQEIRPDSVGRGAEGAKANLYPALAEVRIGCVKYLNAKPLIWTYPGPVRFDHPSGLARDIARDELDAALVPVFEGLRTPHYLLVEGAAVACDGPVYSVFLAYRGEISELKTVALDPASLTSMHLVQVILAEFYGVRPQYVPAGDDPSKMDGQLLIGNQAIDYRANLPTDVRILDLGEEWVRQTGLPFVFALWLLRPGLSDPEGVAREFRQLKMEGVKSIPEIVAADTCGTPELRQRYLTRHIRFEFGAQEKAGLERFRELLAKHGFIPAPTVPLQYV